MKKAFFLGILFLFSVCLLCAQPSFCQTILVDDFNLASGQLLTANGWTAHSAGGTNAISVSGPGLSYSGYPSSGIGNSVALATSGEDDNKTFTVQTSGSVYAAFMVNTSDAAVDANGGYFIHLGPDPISTTFRARVFIKKDASNNISFGLSKAGANLATDVAYTPFSYSLNTTYLLVLKYSIVAGTGNDTVVLFINPTLPGNEPGSATLTAPDSAAADINPGSIALRQGASNTSPTVRVDGIRVGVSWASITTTPDANVDMNGDGRTDFTVVRGTGSPIAEPNTAGKLFTSYRERRKAMLSKTLFSPTTTAAYWYVLINNTWAGYSVPWGDADVDVFLSEDFDGDGKDDVAVYRPGNPGAFYVITASGNGSVLFLGNSLYDDPTVTGDYDGDGKADPAIYSCPDPSAQPGPCYFRYIGTRDNPGQLVTEVALGNGVALDFTPAPGDYDGDGKLDFCIRQPVPGSPSASQYSLIRSTDSGQEQILWGLMSDTNEPGDYDGDHKSDFAVARDGSSGKTHYILTRTGNAFILQWGIAGDAPTPGDYDGDGTTDVSVYRPGILPNNSVFYSISVTRGFISAIPWGSCLTPCDYPVANWNVQ
jgi:hypothetical protein